MIMHNASISPSYLVYFSNRLTKVCAWMDGSIISLLDGLQILRMFDSFSSIPEWHDAVEPFWNILVSDSDKHI